MLEIKEILECNKNVHFPSRWEIMSSLQHKELGNSPRAVGGT